MDPSVTPAAASARRRRSARRSGSRSRTAARTSSSSTSSPTATSCTTPARSGPPRITGSPCSSSCTTTGPTTTTGSTSSASRSTAARPRRTRGSGRRSTTRRRTSRCSRARSAGMPKVRSSTRPRSVPRSSAPSRSSASRSVPRSSTRSSVTDRSGGTARRERGGTTRHAHHARGLRHRGMRWRDAGDRAECRPVGGSADIATRKVLKDSGLDPDKDVTLVSLGSHAQRTAALFAGALQAAVDDPPNTTELMDKGFHNIYDLAGKRLATAQTGTVAQASFIGANREAMQRFVDSQIEAVAWMKKNKPQAVAIMKKYYKAANDAKGFEEAVDFYLGEVFQALPYPKPELWADAQATLGASNAKVKAIDVKTIVDDSFVKSAADRGVDKR